MSIFTDKEIAYLQSQRLARFTTVRPDGTPQIAPVGFHYDAEQDVIYIGCIVSQSEQEVWATS